MHKLNYGVRSFAYCMLSPYPMACPSAYNVVYLLNIVSGFGIFTTKECKKGDFLLEYRGAIVPQQEGQKRSKRYPLHLGSFIYYFKAKGESKPLWYVVVS